jgi:sodium/potassium-transporting ATPase subunit alpha
VPILTNVFFGIPLPLSAFLMICICVLTDMLPALSLMFEKPEKDLLMKPPRNKNHHLVDWKLMLQACLFIGLYEAFVSHFCFFLYLNWYGHFHYSDIFFVYDKWQHGYKNYTGHQLTEFVNKGQTIVFVCLVLVQVFGNIFATRTNLKSVFTRAPFLKKGRNLWIFLAQLITVIIMLLVVYVPAVNNVFNTRPIPVQFFFIPLFFAILLILLDELRKLLVRRKILCFPKLGW